MGSSPSRNNTRAGRSSQVRLERAKAHWPSTVREASDETSERERQAVAPSAPSYGGPVFVHRQQTLVMMRPHMVLAPVAHPRVMFVPGPHGYQLHHQGMTQADVNRLPPHLLAPPPQPQERQPPPIVMVGPDGTAQMAVPQSRPMVTPAAPAQFRPESATPPPGSPSTSSSPAVAAAARGTQQQPRTQPQGTYPHPSIDGNGANQGGNPLEALLGYRTMRL